jgi:methylated-DNA-[protein]-cysteine S-methyltransferase
MTLTIDSPVGPITLTERDGALSGVHLDASAVVDRRRAGFLAEVAGELDGYFAGGRTTFDIPLDLGGTEFQRRVWDALVAIPYGETTSYGELARDIGQPTASRAVGLANARNPVAIIVPCHRVVGADGTLTGYAYGVDRKRWLLDLEQKVRFSAA